MSVPVATEQPREPLPSGYRPWLDGVRALAVIMVAVHHAIGDIPLGISFVGVGLFFGLSGYLITSLLLDERARSGGVARSRFYLRRAARLVPALVLLVLVCNPLLALQDDLAAVRGSAAALTYTANYALVVKSDFMPGYGYTWSLAVEEHFYVLWPIVLLWLYQRYGPRRALQATLILCLLALLWRAVLALLDAPYVLLAFGSAERADALLYGCAAAVAVRAGWRPRRWMMWAGIACAFALPLAFYELNYPALVVGTAVLGLASAAVPVGLDFAGPGWLRRRLSGWLMVHVGVVSYGIYLWHGPLLRMAENAGLNGIVWRMGAVLLAVLAATLSYRYVERPVRSWAHARLSVDSDLGHATAATRPRSASGTLPTSSSGA